MVPWSHCNMDNYIIIERIIPCVLCGTVYTIAIIIYIYYLATHQT